MSGSLIIVAGPAGAGKSTYGKKLAVKKAACFLDSDTVSEAVVRAGMQAARLNPDDRDSPAYRHHFRDPVYQSLFAVALENIRQVNVVMIGPFTSEIRNESWLNELEECFRCQVELHYVICDSKERRKRIAARGNPRDEWKLAHWEEYLLQSASGVPRCPHVVINTHQ